MMKVTDRLRARQTDARENRPVLIACLGDSVTHGCFEVFTNRYGNIDTYYRPDQGYAARLRTRLNRYYPAAAITVLNAGISGDSAAGGEKRVERDVLAFHPDLVIVDFGLNDAMNPDVDAGLKLYETSMRLIFDKILRAGAEAMLLTPNFMCDYVAPSVPEGILREVAAQAADVQMNGILTRYVEAARAIAANKKIPVADAYARWQSLKNADADTTALLANDINHPLPEMHDLFVEEIERRLFEVQ